MGDFVGSRSSEPNRRVLVVDDDPVIHGYFRKILSSITPSERSQPGGISGPTTDVVPFAVDAAIQGAESLALVERALDAGRPYALAFVDMNMPPGWDGVETIRRLWAVDDTLQVVICTAHSDLVWAESLAPIGGSARLLILKKPFDPAEVRQLGLALTEKWTLERHVQSRISDLRETVAHHSELLARSHFEFQALQQALDQNVICSVTDHRGIIIEANEPFCRISQYSRAELVGKSHKVINSGCHPTSFWADMWRTIAGGDWWRGEICNRARDGSLFWVDTTITPYRNPAGVIEKYVSLRVDVTARKAAEAELRKMAMLDPLTGLPNRSLLLDRLTHYVHRATEPAAAGFAVFFLDFDRFKLINDSLGHDIGDAMLREIAARLRRHLDISDTLDLDDGGCTAARLGGDEFVVIRGNIQSPDDATAVAEGLLHEFASPYSLGEHEVFSTVSIGVVTYHDGYRQADELLRDADTAMYEAKLAGKGRYVLFDAAMRERVLRRLEIEVDLRRALRANEFQVLYQPILSLETGRVVGAEALLRWNHPRFGLIPPGEFIPVAEETGVIGEIGDWVVRQACEQHVRWQRSDPEHAPPTVSVNLSRTQLASEDFIRRLDAILAETGLAPAALQLEVPESQVLENQHELTNVLRRLKARGIRLAMDDFGTGLSSLSGLHNLPFDVVKIDRAFVSDMSRGRSLFAVAHAVITLARNLGMSTVAEGIEHQDQVVGLQMLDCEYGQGYLFAHPMTADDLSAFLVGPRPEVSRPASLQAPLPAPPIFQPPIMGPHPPVLGPYPRNYPRPS